MLRLFSELSAELKYELSGIVLGIAAIFTLASLVGLNTGPAGLFIAKFLRYAFGIGASVLPLLLLAIASRYVWTRRAIDYSIKFWGLFLTYILLLAIYHHFKIPLNQEILPESLVPGGGLVGGMILFSLRKLFGISGSIIVLSGLSLCSVVLSTTWSLAKTLVFAKDKASESLINARQAVACTWENTVGASSSAEDGPSFYNQDRDLPREYPPVKAVPRPPAPPKAGAKQDLPPADLTPLPPVPAALAQYKLPSINSLKKATKPRLLKTTKELSDNARLLEATLDNFGVGAKVVNASQGPSVTRYELEPAPGVKISRIVSLADDIALKLAAPGVRIEAPIPGKAAVGIEVPNKEVFSVPLREVLESQEYQRANSRLTAALGKDITGLPIMADLAKMPHLLVAGATGSGKSVCINTLIVSILFKARPDEVKFLLIDPKVVELSNYNGIPHLLTPVITDAKKASAALRWAVQEMERRYALFAAAGVRDFSRYNDMIEDDRLPLIVIIIDELADLMMVAPVDVEDAICRLAQMARAAGLHLVLATQRPSVDVITGTIKANIPSRISFAVSSQVDSRTILDMAGAEKLLGKGDMLYYPVGSSKPLRLQGAFISDSEVEELVAYLKGQSEPEYTEGVTAYEEFGEKNARETFEDELLEEAVRMVLETGQASVSMLQRKFRVGYTRAARLIDTMEEMKIIGPNIGSKARDILMTSDQVYSRYFSQN
ncbi:MAG: DNA translocase FtsK 4TM domain-containing protein [Negativicutes bacterium]|nr:DNA translocase FtsK 4TM domain-containing protein [Negativicutes bacterium]